MLVSSHHAHAQKPKAQAAKQHAKVAASPKKHLASDAELLARYPISKEFLKKAKAIMKDYDAPVEVLLNIIATETQGTFSPSIESKNKHATGLIQFTQEIAEQLDTSQAKLRKMSAEHQLKYVDKYFEMKFDRYLERTGQKKLDTKKLRPVDFYAAVFCPLAIGKPMNQALYSAKENPGEYQRNKSVDKNRDRRITLQELYNRYLDYEKKYSKAP